MGYGDQDTEEGVVRPLFHLASEDAPGEAVTFTFPTDNFDPGSFLGHGAGVRFLVGIKCFSDERAACSVALSALTHIPA